MRCFGKIRVSFDDLDDEYDLHGLAADNNVDLKRFQPIGLQFEWYKEVGTVLTVYCLPRPFRKIDGEVLPIKAFKLQDFSFEDFIKYFAEMKIQVHPEFKTDSNIEFEDIFSNLEDSERENCQVFW